MKDVSKRRNNPQERPWYNPALKLIKGTNKKYNKILDLGCGLCEFSEKLRKNNYKNITCVDGSQNYVTKAKKLGFKSFKVDLNNELPFKNNEFDLIVHLEVIEHIENAENVIEEISRVLKNKGNLIISTPNFSFLGVRLAILLGAVQPDESYHFRFFNYKTLKKLLKKNNLEIKKTYCISFLPFYRIIKKIKKKNRGKKMPKGRKIYFMKNLLSSKLIFLCEKKIKLK